MLLGAIETTYFAMIRVEPYLILAMPGKTKRRAFIRYNDLELCQL